MDENIRDQGVDEQEVTREQRLDNDDFFPPYTSESLPRVVQEIETARLEETELRGAYLHIYKPELADGQRPDLAVKVFNTKNRAFAEAGIRMDHQTDDAELQAILSDNSYVHLANNPERLLEQCDRADKTFIFLATEHMKHQEFFGEFVQPAAFATFTAREDIETGDPYDPTDEAHAWLMAHHAKRNQLSATNRHAYVTLGNPAFVMLQAFEKLGPSLFNLESSSLTDEQRAQIETFAGRVKDVYEEYGYYPDDSMWKQQSGNLRFNNEGKLVLIDTNHLYHKSFDQYSSPQEFLERLKPFYE